MEVFLTELQEALLFVPKWKDVCLTIMSDMQKSSNDYKYLAKFHGNTISALRKISNDAADWLLSDVQPKCMWARHTYDSPCKSDHVTNNACEVFNAWIGDYKK
ncbi:hypothetical protein JHK87_001178 [Glycine soja]|nr:hypothetical protein JHK87_001178 [Glycine soja]